MPWRGSKLFLSLISINSKNCLFIQMVRCPPSQALFGFSLQMQSIFRLLQIFLILFLINNSIVILDYSPEFICVKMNCVKNFLITLSHLALIVLINVLDFSIVVLNLILTILSVMTVFHNIFSILLVILQYRHTFDFYGQTLINIKS